MRWFALGSLIFFSGSAFAADSSSVCPNPKKLKGLCMYIGEMQKAVTPIGRYEWKYQTRLMEAACADPLVDDEATIARKIAKVWNENEEKLWCESTRFDVPKGSLIKYAVSTKFDVFLIDMVNWGVNLNKVDASDNRTVLDYVEYQMIRNEGTASAQILKRYYEMLREGGAKHRRELR